ncbi:nephronectin-like [Pseudochaenichthys georgianus]|uniref:nephronectin-like n=1 Tax=Pseudochaenichthys georgianus TaxID=52239 RepID=UPI0039C1F148
MVFLNVYLLCPDPTTSAPPLPLEMELELLENEKQDAIWSYPTCPDVEECRLGLHNCHSFATCINTPTSYECHCERGYTGDGTLHCNQTTVCYPLHTKSTEGFTSISPCSACKDTCAPTPTELMFLMLEPSAPTPTETNITVPVAPEISAEPCQSTLHPPAAPTQTITQAINGPQLSSSASCLRPGCQSVEVFAAAAEDLDEGGAAIHGALARLRSCTQPSKDGVIVAWRSPARADSQRL